jgi:AraC-like DNA-binding protein
MWLELTDSNGAKFMLNFDQIIKFEPDSSGSGTNLSAAAPGHRIYPTDKFSDVQSRVDLLRAQGGVLRYVQSRRLERIRAALADPRETRRISDVAAEFGFLRGDHFARAFKHQYGQSARDVRNLTHRPPEAVSETSPAGLGGSDGFDDWIRALPG